MGILVIPDQGSGSKTQSSSLPVDPSRPESLGRLWSAYEFVGPGKVKGMGGKQLVDVVFKYGQAAKAGGR